ncbi:Uncharacterised protein [Mycobacterium tuberculosis]|nr:Uncharacterised protein [Mycobacterium tuberculosis]
MKRTYNANSILFQYFLNEFLGQSRHSGESASNTRARNLGVPFGIKVGGCAEEGESG